jgi:hypothetical protein
LLVFATVTVAVIVAAAPVTAAAAAAATVTAATATVVLAVVLRTMHFASMRMQRKSIGRGTGPWVIDRGKGGGRACSGVVFGQHKHRGNVAGGGGGGFKYFLLKRT